MRSAALLWGLGASICGGVAAIEEPFWRRANETVETVESAGTSEAVAPAETPKGVGAGGREAQRNCNPTSTVYTCGSDCCYAM
jgi:hypothetical protein